VATLFRGTSAATSLMDQYMKMVAVPYVQLTLRDVVVRIMECKHSCEVRDIALLLSHDVTKHVSHDITYDVM
jgi:Ras GTPase-activating protein 1